MPPKVRDGLPSTILKALGLDRAEAEPLLGRDDLSEIKRGYEEWEQKFSTPAPASSDDPSSVARESTNPWRPASFIAAAAVMLAALFVGMYVFDPFDARWKVSSSDSTAAAARSPSTLMPIPLAVQPAASPSPTPAAASPIVLSQAFDEAHARRLMRPGPNAVRGNGYLLAQDGSVVTCAGSWVILTPATAYATERMLHGYGSKSAGAGQLEQPSSVPDPAAYEQNRHETRCDSQGFFTFYGVANGTFYVTTRVDWGASADAQGGRLMKRVLLRGGRTTSVVLTS